MHYRLPGPFNEAPYVLVRMLPDAFSRIDERVKHCQLPVHTASYSSSSSSSRVIVHPDPSSSYRGHSFSIARGGIVLNRSELMEERWYSFDPLHPRICIRTDARTPFCTVIIPFCSTEYIRRFLDCLQILARLMVIANVGFLLSRCCTLFRARLDRLFSNG